MFPQNKLNFKKNSKIQKRLHSRLQTPATDRPFPTKKANRKWTLVQSNKKTIVPEACDDGNWTRV
jgi:hypothetical protein